MVGKLVTLLNVVYMVVSHVMGTIGFRIKVTLLIVLASGLLVGCFNNLSHDENIPIIELKANSITNEVSNLSSYVSELEVIPLVKDTTAFRGVTKLLISDRYIVLSGGVVFSVSLDGEDLIKIGDVGRGPGEYLSVKDIAISPDGKELWFLELYNSVLRYNAVNGVFIGKVDIPKNVGYVKGIIPVSATEFALYIPNPTSGYCLEFYGIDGRNIGHTMHYTQYNFDMGFSIPTTVSEGTTYVVSPESKMPTVVYHNGKPEKQFVFDFGSKNAPNKYYSLNQDNPWNGLSTLFELDYFKNVSSVFFINDEMYFRAFGKDSASWNYYINKDRTRGIRWQSIGIMAPPICSIASADGYIYFPYEDYGYLSIDEEKDALKKLVIERYGLPNRPGATFIIKVKFDVS